MKISLAETQNQLVLGFFPKTERMFGRTQVTGDTENSVSPKKKKRSSFIHMCGIRQTFLLSAESSSFYCKFWAAGKLMICTLPFSLLRKKMTAGPGTRRCHLYACD